MLGVDGGDEGGRDSYYMAGSASGQDESNPALRLATRAGKAELSCPLGITRCPFARHLKLNPWTMQSFHRFSHCSVGKCFLNCSENCPRKKKGKEKETDMKSS